MAAFGYTLSSEEHPPATLVRNAAEAEAAGFDFCSISDHFHPWTQRQGHSPFVWSVLGAIANATERIHVGTGVTCPILRIHPVIVAHAAATASLLFDGRFFLGVGTGEALNEHVLGQQWPRPEVRRAMLAEAVQVMRDLWTGETVDRSGKFYEVENARLFDAPRAPIPIVVSGFGTASAELAGGIGDGYWGHAGDRETVQAYERAGGRGPRYAQIDCCWATDADDARTVVMETWPNGAIPGQLSQDLPTWSHFEQAAKLVDAPTVAAQVPCGPDIAETLVGQVDEALDAGLDHLYFHQIGPDQAGFLRFWERELAPALADRRVPPDRVTDRSVA